MKNWFVYILRCSDNSLYTGITTDLDGRLAAHNSGAATRYTRTRLPVEMIWHEPHPDISSARGREFQIKAWQKDKKLALIHKNLN